MKRLILVFAFLISTTSQAQSTEERFQDVFITAGYATAFGAALGAASLSFFNSPEQHLQYVAIGASLGFIGGSVLGSYIVFSPVVAENPAQESNLLASGQVPVQGLAIRPVFSPTAHRLNAVESAWTIASF
jgi:hypothetical protein